MKFKAMLIVKMSDDEDIYIKRIEDTIVASGGVIERINHWYKRCLMRENCSNQLYVEVNFTADESDLYEINRSLSADGAINRQYIEKR